ncbi:MAG: potassium channel family protein [Virgibacillus proomii]|jgi:voltage-gated potassium channel
MSFRLIKQIYFKLPILLKVLMVILLFMFLFGFLIHLVEPDQFPSIFDGIWWAFITGATVGYGDLVPSTPAGKIVAICLVLTGGSLIAYYITSLAALTFHQEQEMEAGKIAFKGYNHLVIIGWNERSRQLIKIISKSSPQIQMVLIDTTLQHVPFSDYPVHFIKGDPTEDRILQRANVKLADRVLITADITRSERTSDNMSILTVVAIRGNNPSIPIIVEIMSSAQIANAKRAGATTILRSNDFTSTLFYHELIRQPNARPFEDIFHLLSTQQFHHSVLNADMEKMNFDEVASLLRNKQQILIGFIRNNQYHMNPSVKSQMQNGDLLISFIPWKK